MIGGERRSHVHACGLLAIIGRIGYMLCIFVTGLFGCAAEIKSDGVL